MQQTNVKIPAYFTIYKSFECVLSDAESILFEFVQYVIEKTL